MSRKLNLLPVAMLAGLALSTAVSAQPWEEVYGRKDQRDEGHRRVTPVTQCPDRGYVAIGTKDLAGFPVVYVVRTDNGGNTIWERYFDVGVDGRPDEGFALVELKDGSGFITTGTSNRGTQWWAHAMKIDCNGRNVLTFFYPQPFTVTTPYRLVGHDIREAFTGDGVTTNAGDLLIAGYLEFSGRADAILLRLDANLNLVWHRRIDTGANERFFGLTETRPTFSATGDIAAVGDWVDSNGRQALVARIDGLAGDFTGSPDQCMAIYGRQGEEDFQSIVEVQNWPDTGNLTMAGRSTSPGMAEDVYVVQTKPNPCGMLAQVTIGNESGLPYREYARDLIEVLYPVDPGLGVPVGSFALTGGAEADQVRQDAFLLFIKPSSLHPLAARRYGDHAGFVDFGTSLQQNSPWGPQPPGFVLAGTSLTFWFGSPDPSDLYLIQPTDSGKTGCEKEWFPDGLDQPWDPRRLDPIVRKVVNQEQQHLGTDGQDTVIRVCN
jgi:hypothetical protein